MVAEQPDAGFRYWAFISYSHQDTSWGRWVHRALESYRLPSRLVGQPIAAGAIPPRLSPVFRDRDELSTATDLDRTVAAALQQSWSLVVVCSPAAARSRWVNEEVREFRRLGRAARIHCLIVDGAPDATASSCFPPALRDRAAADARDGEPVAADPRRTGDGKADARLKLVAGILGIRLDTLVRREHQRGYRRMALAAAAAVCAFAVLAVFSFITVTSRRDAEAQRSHAEGLVEFMLGDLRQKLQPEGKLGTLDAVGKEALAYYASQDPASLDADALARRARALHLIGDVYEQRGQLDDALGVFRNAAASTAELLVRDPDNPQRIFDHAQSVYWVGLIAWRRGQAANAEAEFRQYQRLAGRLTAKDPANPDWQAEAEYADSNLGTLLLDQGRLDEAASAFERALGVAMALRQGAPHDPGRQSELAQAHAWLAQARAAQGRFDDAVAQRDAEIALCEEALATDPKNRDARGAMLTAERELGDISLMRGDVPLAISQLRRAVMLADELMADDPDNTASANDAAGAYADFAEAAGYGPDAGVARTAAAHARDIATRLVERDASVVIWQTRLCRSLLLQAGFMTADGDVLGALRQVQGVLQRLDGLGGADRLDQGVRAQYARALLMSGQGNAVLGNATRSHDDWMRLIAFLQREPGTSQPAMQALLATGLRAVGRMEESAPIIERLAAIGYRAPDFLPAEPAPGASPKDVATVARRGSD